ncbi:hypothetical protein [Plantactinospora sp. KBS50]|uniref:hypothetical protein n=1 Tax=Plantactinospora sp. KBS50 TaxID=2024580 RepID=UPI000BAA982C|nr:hypothetical protein [Plantactinospora sp. KBS50]ASW53812.1 hypothetical protein CIK06_05860 [Plantactinospora sp. KBS50]
MDETPDLPYPARGYVDMLLHALGGAPDLSDSSAAVLAAGLVDGRFFAGTVDEFAGAVGAAVRHGRLAPDSVALSRRHREAELLDFLARLSRRLDGLRPWPGPAFARLPVGTWPGIAQAPPIARVLLPADQLAGMLRERFDELDAPGGPLRAVVLRLRGGAVVALRTPARPEAAAELLSREPDHAGVVRQFQTLIGLAGKDLGPAPPPHRPAGGAVAERPRGLRSPRPWWRR